MDQAASIAIIINKTVLETIDRESPLRLWGFRFRLLKP